MSINTVQKVFCFTFSFLLLFNTCVFAQLHPLKDDLLKLNSAVDSLNKKNTIEKLYLQFDKPHYASGDTIWFKAYLLNSYLRSSDKSRMINIDIVNDSNKVIKQYRLPLQNGLSSGNIYLDEKEFTTGTYTLRGYTNWMRNFGEDRFFYKSFYIGSASENNLLVNTRFSTSAVNDNRVLNAKLLFSDVNKIFFVVKPMLLQVMDGNKRLYKQNLQTGVDGVLDINFNLPQKVSNLAIVAESEQKHKKVIIPVVLNRPEKADVQFLPEGGSFVAGLPAHIGFKVIGEDGKGLNVTGIITDHNQKQVAVFTSLHRGIGCFDLTAKDGESYTAKISLPGGLIKEYPLPGVKSTGTVLQLKNSMETDSVEVTVAATNDIAQSGKSYFLIGKARGIVCYAAIVNFYKGSYVKRRIAKNLFPTGITHFTLMTTKYQPINERLVFIDQRDNLNIKISSDKPFYDKRDRVALKLTVTDKEGNPVQGDFSMAVTDDAQVKTDTLNNENIMTRLLFTSDLKGYIEESGYYLSSKTNEAWQALDNLLRTQGWVSYNWGQAFNQSPVQYDAEQEFTIKGKVTNAFNKPLINTDVILLSKKPAFLIDTVTNKDGRFIFKNIPPADTAIYFIQARNKHGKSFNVDINIDEIKSPPFIKPSTPLIMPWYINSDTTLLNYTKNEVLVKQQEYFPVGEHKLKEVKITASRLIKDSQNLNGPGNADLVLDEKELEKMGKKTFLDIFTEKIKGFREGLFRTSPFAPDYIKQFESKIRGAAESEWYFIHDKPIILVIDGIEMRDIFVPFNFLDLRDYLKLHTAEDIKGIEVNASARYNSKYLTSWRDAPIDILTYRDFAFIEVTTRSGNGPGIGNTPGMYLYKPLPLSWPKEFYKPKYSVKDTTNHLQDIRSTIDWEPNITTDADGEAKLWFYTADKPSTYTIIIEGTDMNGNLGYKTGKIYSSKGKKSDKH